ncbi:hypothetical protein CV102_14000 [Natronococcus pandeyae]|uniref:Uncharacterized protein n=1 Tax=Natronococcus pandeyae TaxID=2055836 RepID=A0A8J8Q592_9EURY|nr:hypothetical protein [Natronococcus pandeyae]TYL37844.1 hypothetical protein CV102_14000 [Natronococcus pandeyae]
MESKSELVADLNRKQKRDEISTETAVAFTDLYEFAQEIGDRTTIGQAKNANFQLKVDAHQGKYQGNPSVFTANVDGDLKVWPARMPLDHDEGLESIAWDPADYEAYERAFKSLNGNPRRVKSVAFEKVAAHVDLDEFKSIVKEFVTSCRQAERAAN